MNPMIRPTLRLAAAALLCLTASVAAGDGASAPAEEAAPTPPPAESQPQADPNAEPAPPEAGQTITLEPGEHRDLHERIEQAGVVRIVGPRDAVVLIDERIRFEGEALIFQGVTMRTEAAKPIEGNEENALWLIDVDYTGRALSEDRKQATEAPGWRFHRSTFIGSDFRHFRRGSHRTTHVYRCTYADIYEDLFQGAGIIVRDVKAQRVGAPRRFYKGHADVLHPWGKMDVDGLMVEGYAHQGINLQDARATGSIFRNITLSGHDGNGGSGVLLETAVGRNGPSDLLLEDVSIDHVFRVRHDRSHEKVWEGDNVTVRRCNFKGWPNRDSRITIERR